MLETVDLTLTTPKDVYKEERERLVAELSVLQQQCLRENIGSIISFDGWDAAGKGSRISNLVSELDARSLTTWSIHKPVGDEARKPFMERFWSKVGRHGTMTIFDQSWYSRAVHMLLENDPDLRREKRSEELGRILEDAEDPYGDPSNRESEEILRSITSFEHQFASDGYVIIKFFLHISKKEQKKRLDKLAASDDTSWRVGKEDYRRNRRYDDLAELVDMFLEKTDYVYAPWTVVPATDWRTANLVILRTIIAALKKALARKETEKLISPAETAALSRAAHADTVISRFPLLRVPSLDDVTYDNTITNEDYQRELDEQQDRLTSNALQLYRKRIPVMIAYEGWDAAGKGGNIKRVARALDARDYRIYPSSAPTPEEKEHPFLWRYWTRLPKTGHFGIYDRTWYGRVLVERVEGFASTKEWQRAYDEINEFEWEMEQWGAILIKFWIDVSDEEQLNRFKDRQNNPAKRWKITDEDWRNRDKNPQYRVAVNDMIRLTSTPYAPWHIIESDDKHFARVKALKIINETIEERLK